MHRTLQLTAIPYSAYSRSLSGLQIDRLLSDPGSVQIYRAIVVPKQIRIDVGRGEVKRVGPRRAVERIGSRVYRTQQGTIETGIPQVGVDHVEQAVVVSNRRREESALQPGGISAGIWHLLWPRPYVAR